MKTASIFPAGPLRLFIALAAFCLAIPTTHAQDAAPADNVLGYTAPLGKQDSKIEIVDKLDKPAGKAFSQDDCDAYVMAYFKDQTQSAYLAVSRDGYTFTDVNDGRPVFDGSILAEQRGVRDPHIARGPDGAFYLAMTDLHISAQRAGFRDTQWQRPEAEFGWGNNRALVLMKSYDLIHWTHADILVDESYPELGVISSAWAPQTLYDPQAGKMMVYFTIRETVSEGGAAYIYYAYTNDDFTRLVSTPKKISDIGCIDADITRVGDRYHMFYVSRAQIKHAASDTLIGGYTAEPERIDPNRESTEAPNVFKRLGTDKWVLMYDVYGARPNNMGFSETTDFQTYEDLGRFNDGPMKGTNFERPKHGAVTHMTAEELRKVKDHWGLEGAGE